ncbi:aminotransferase class I/II-fold pyridoxal phosphate-dependent enzyme [Methylobacter psychrophilus]|uniref:aminotransferase class I/II-fold pyridoxal phosphate-dependent enzyme n=1 Tax=Methylobacter psychrophilus TaxID=96941 RepID=UPI0021D4B03C|nr:aminotransferase class I/II-fold pyridoxal phosphate-dependent enzyme [Methylobacter psychrophilus]
MQTRLAERNSEISSFYVMELLRRAKQLESQGKDIIHMEIGEPDFPTPLTIVDAGIKHIQTGEVKYTPAAGLPELRKKIAAFYVQRYGVTIDEQRIFVTPGASGAFLLAFGVSLNPQEELLMADPCYPCNSNFATLFGSKTKTIAVDAGTGYQLTAQLIKKHWTPATKGALIASPSNPTGTLITPEELQQAIATVNDLSGCFYSDEIYHGLVYDATATTALAFSDDVFVINSFSKYFGMTGWRIGWLIVPNEFIEATEKLAQNIYISTSTPAQYAALAAFDKNTLAELENRRREFAARRDFLYDNLLRLGFEIPIKPAGAFYIYANAKKFTDDSYQFALDFLEAEGVAITPGKDFGSNEAHHMLRFSYTTSLAKMTIAIQRLDRFINKG